MEKGKNRSSQKADDIFVAGLRGRICDEQSANDHSHLINLTLLQVAYCLLLVAYCQLSIRHHFHLINKILCVAFIKQAGVEFSII